MTTHNDKAGTTPLQGNAGGASPALSTVRHHQAPCQCWARGCLLYSPLGSTQGLQMMSQPKSAQDGFSSQGWRASSASRTGTAGGGQSAMCLNRPVFDECNLHFQFHEPEQSSWTRHRNVCYAVQQLYAQDGHEMSASSK